MTPKHREYIEYDSDDDYRFGYNFVRNVAVINTLVTDGITAPADNSSVAYGVAEQSQNPMRSKFTASL